MAPWLIWPTIPRRPRPDVPAAYDASVGPPLPHYRRPPLAEWDDPTWCSVEVDDTYMRAATSRVEHAAELRRRRPTRRVGKFGISPIGHAICRDVPGGVVFLHLEAVDWTPHMDMARLWPSREAAQVVAHSHRGAYTMPIYAMAGDHQPLGRVVLSDTVALCRFAQDIDTRTRMELGQRLFETMRSMTGDNSPDAARVRRCGDEDAELDAELVAAVSDVAALFRRGFTRAIEAGDWPSDKQTRRTDRDR